MVSQPVHQLLIAFIELEEQLIIEFVRFVYLRVWFNSCFDPDPLFNFREIVEKTYTSGSQKSVTVAGTNLLFGDVQPQITGICNDLQPKRILCPAANRKDPLGLDAFRLHDLEVMPDAKSNAFENGAIKIAFCVLQA